MNSNVLIHGRTVDNRKIALRCDEIGYLDTQTILNDGNGNFLKINANGSLNVNTTSDYAPLNINVLLNSPQSIAIQADSVVRAVADTVNNRKGWWYKNDDGKGTTGLKMNYYFYDGSGESYTVGDLKLISSILTFDNKDCPAFFVVYTKPTGTNDYIPNFAHSSRVYQLYTPNLPINGEKFIMYWSKDTNLPANPTNLLLLACGEGTTYGEYNDTMEVAYITIHTASNYLPAACSNLYETLSYVLNPLSIDSGRNTININLTLP